MSYGFIRSLVLVTVGALIAGHALFRWARKRGDAGELAASLAIALGTVATGLALQSRDGLGAGVLLGALALIVAGLVALARRRSGSLPE